MIVLIHALLLLFSSSFGQEINEVNDCGPPKAGELIYGCPSGWATYKRTCYKFVQNNLKNYAAARAACTKENARLLRIDDFEQKTYITNYLDTNALNKTQKWYTSGRMDALQSRQFIWEGHPDNRKQFSNALSAYWLMVPPRKGDNKEWPSSQTYVVFGSDAANWGFYLVEGKQKRPYICQAEKILQRVLVSERRSFLYGATDLMDVQRGPCFYKKGQARDLLYIQTDAGTPVIFNCVAYARPSPTYKWYRVTGSSASRVLEEISPLKPKYKRFSITNGALTISTPIPSEDSGEYQCLAKNLYGKILGNPVTLKFASMGRPPNIAQSDVIVASYEGTFIKCATGSYSPPSLLRYSWRIIRGSNPLPQTLRTEVLPNVFVSQTQGKLYFSSATKNDEGQYFCVYQANVKGSPAYRSSPIRMLIRSNSYTAQNPKVMDNFPAMLPPAPKSGDLLRLECFAYGRSEGSSVRLRYRWSRKGLSTYIPMKIPGRAKISDFGRVMTIENVDIADSGRYSCQAEDTDKRLSSWEYIDVNIQAAPFFVTKVSDQHVDLQTTVRFECKATAKPGAEYTWYKDNVRISGPGSTLPNKRYTVNTDMRGTPYLEIRNAIESDKGMYGCMAKNSHGTVFSYGQLRVMSFAPTFDKYPVENQEGVAGGDVFLRCQAEGAPKPTVTWSRVGSQLPNSLPQAQADKNTGAVSCPVKFCQLKNGNLFIQGVEGSDAGEYTCTAENILGTASSSGRLRVLQQLKATLKPENKLVLVNATLDLPCQVAAAPNLDVNYAWKFEQVEILFDRWDLDRRRYETSQFYRPYGRDFGTLRIENIQYDNEGNYTCLIETPLDNTIVFALIRVMGPPGPCAGVYLPPINNKTEIPINWRNGANHHSPIDSYRIDLQLDGQLEWKEHIVKTKKDVRVINEGGQDFGLRASSITGLPRNQTFRARVVAANGFGFGQPSPASDKFLTMSGAPNMAPGNVTGGGGKIGTLVITWDPIPKENQGGSEFTYEIEYKRKGEMRWMTKNSDKTTAPLDMRTVQMEGKKLKYTILVGTQTYYQLYEVRICGRNTVTQLVRGNPVRKVQKGPFSKIAEIRSAEKIPIGSVSSVSATGLNSTAIDVFWDPIKNMTGGRILGYRIVYWLKPETSTDCVKESSTSYDTAHRQTVIGNVGEGRIIGLEVDKYYCITVQAFNSAGDGSESDPAEETTFKQAPTEFPTMVFVNGTGKPGTVLVDWVGIQSRPQEESLDGYKIRYWLAGAPATDFRDIDCGLDTHGYLTNLAKDTRYDVRIFGYSRGGVGKMSSPMIQFQLVDPLKCTSGASWDGPDIRYVFICSGCRTGLSLSLILLSVVVHLTRWMF